MKRMRCIMLMLLCLMLGVAALGETQCMYIELPGDFAPYGGGWGLAEDGSVWIGGGFGTPGQTRGGLLRVGLDGSCADVTPAGDRMEGLYGDVVPLGEDSCIAVRSMNLESGYVEYVGRLDAGRLLWKWESTRYDCRSFVAAAWREDGGVVALEQGGAVAFTPEGEVAWTHAADAWCRDLAAVDGGFLLTSISGSGEVHVEFLEADGGLRQEEFIPTGREWSDCAPFVSGGSAYVLLKNMYAGGEGLGLMKLDAADPAEHGI